MITKQQNVKDILSERKTYVTPHMAVSGVDWPVLMLYASVTVEHTTEGWTEDEERGGNTGSTEEVDGTGWF